MKKFLLCIVIISIFSYGTAYAKGLTGQSCYSDNECYSGKCSTHICAECTGLPCD